MWVAGASGWICTDDLRCSSSSAGTSLIVDSRLKSDKWVSRRFLQFDRLESWIGVPSVVSTSVERAGRLTVLKRRKLSVARIASAPGSSSAFSTSATALMPLDSWVASETLSAAFASCRRITPQQMTLSDKILWEGIPRKPRTTVTMTVGLLLPNPRNRTADDTMVALVK